MVTDVSRQRTGQKMKIVCAFSQNLSKLFDQMIGTGGTPVMLDIIQILR